MTPLLLVFVHGYSVTNLDTYGELPLRLQEEARARGLDARIENIYLGRYVSFHDEVRLDDVSRAMELAVRQQLPTGTRFVCITHSTGGPVVRNWWHLFYEQATTPCPMSHLIMLAPANHGSALAQLGKTRLSRVKSWFDGLEPGQKILDWLELGSSDAWRLNLHWIRTGATALSERGFFPFVLTGQSIDRKLYDHINAYTGELGSDGVVRVASANLNSRYLRLSQQRPALQGGTLRAPGLEITEYLEAPGSPMRIISGKSHSGEKMGIMRSVLRSTGDQNSQETIQAIFDCIAVNNPGDYTRLAEIFKAQTEKVRQDELIEIEKKLLKQNVYIHDRYCMVMFRVRDHEGFPLTNFDLLLTGPGDDPDMLPSGFFADRQYNRVNQSTLSYYFNYDVLTGTQEAVKNGEVFRKALKGIGEIGLIIRPRPDEGFVRYLPCQISSSSDLFKKLFQPNATTLVDIELRRVVSQEIFRFERPDENRVTARSFKDTEPGHTSLS
jgi:hypothetical protein